MLNVLNSPEVLMALMLALAGGLPASACILALRIRKIGPGGLWFK